MQILGSYVDKFTVIECMLAFGEISLDRAEELIKAHPDEVESEWLVAYQLEGAFSEFNA